MSKKDLLRRDFMRWGAVAGIATTLPGMVALPQSGIGASNQKAPLFVSFQAGGGYDITLICDPVGNNGSSRPVNNGYRASDIKVFGSIKVAPQIPAVVDFFSTYYENILIINGIDTSTIDHATGARSSMSGYGSAGYPVTGALVGAVLGSGLPAPFMSNGGANYTGNIVSLTQLGSGISDALFSSMDGNGIHHPQVWVDIQQAMTNRLSREQQQAVASRRSQHLKLMQQAFIGAGAMSELTNTINSLSVNVPQANPHSLNLSLSDNNIALNIRVGLAGYFHDQTAALHIGIGGFDTHSDNDSQQQNSCQALFSAIDYLLRCASYLGVSDNMLVHVGSDFSRTPYYNSVNGKDHWPTTSVLLINPAQSPNMPVGTVFGGSDGMLNSLAVDRKTLQIDNSGVSIQPGHIHDAIRRYMGISSNPLVELYDLHMSETLPLLG